EAYFRELAITDLEVGRTGTDALDAALPGSDFIGTRLHAGVRAIQKSRPALILAVDNRASEISNDTRLRVIARENVDEIVAEFTHSDRPNLTVPVQSIDAWLDAMRRLG